MKSLVQALGLCLLATCAPVYANDPNWNGDPEPPVVEPAPQPSPVAPTPVDGDSEYTTAGQIAYGVCDCTRLTVAWGLEDLLTRKINAEKQCYERRVRMSCEGVKEN